MNEFDCAVDSLKEVNNLFRKIKFSSISGKLHVNHLGLMLKGVNIAWT